MKIQDLRNYGAAFSSAEGAWPPEVKARMRRRSRDVIMRNLKGFQKLRFFFIFMKWRRQASRLDISDLRARGMSDDAFLSQQLEYLAMFATLVELFGKERSVAIMKEVMDEAAYEPLMMCLPDPEHVRQLEYTPLAIFRDYIEAMAEASVMANCNEMRVIDLEGDEGAFELNVTWCIWLELAQRMGIPEGCQPNCYADDLVFPKYFDALGMRYGRTQTLACGGSCCDFRFASKGSDEPPRG